MRKTRKSQDSLTIEDIRKGVKVLEQASKPKPFQWNCPKCNKPVHDSYICCRCGIIFGKIA